MLPVKRPDIGAGSTFDDCTRTIQDPNLRARMVRIRNDIIDRSTDL